MNRLVGMVISGGTNREVPFVIVETQRVKVNHYYFVAHPIYGKNVLLAVFSINPYNPEMEPGSPGVLTAKRGIRTQSGKYLESHIAKAEILGYFDDKRKWRQLEVALGIGTEVHEPTENELREFFLTAKQDRDVLYIDIGRVQGTDIPVSMDLNAIAKSHILVAGMTRAGKSSFIINLALKSGMVSPRPRIVIFDRRREYGPLTKYPGVRIVPYKFFAPVGFDPDVAARRLGLTGKVAEVFASALRRLPPWELNYEALLARIDEEAGLRYRRDAQQTKAYLEKIVASRGSFLFENREVRDIIHEVLRTPTLIIDFSTDSDVESQHRAAADIMRKLMRHAMGRKGDFAVIVCVEEAQYFAPERGSELETSSAQSEVKAKFSEAISQAGGYNLGLVIMTQRPAYVSKGILSQCNSVACFRLKSGNDQDALVQYTEYGSDKLKDILPGLADHEAVMWGLALQNQFPVVAELDVAEYPQKALVSAKQAWARLDDQRTSHRLEIQKPEIEEPVTVD